MTADQRVCRHARRRSPMAPGSLLSFSVKLSAAEADGGRWPGAEAPPCKRPFQAPDRGGLRVRAKDALLHLRAPARRAWTCKAMGQGTGRHDPPPGGRRARREMSGRTRWDHGERQRTTGVLQNGAVLGCAGTSARSFGHLSTRCCQVCSGAPLRRDRSRAAFHTTRVSAPDRAFPRDAEAGVEHRVQAVRDESAASAICIKRVTTGIHQGACTAPSASKLLQASRKPRVAACAVAANASAPDA